MQIEPLELHHQVELNALLKSVSSCFSEYSFANLYLFRKNHEYEVVRFNSQVFVRGKTQDKKCFLMPLFTLQNIPFEELKKSLINADFFFPITEEYAAKVSSQATFFEQESDYLFHTEKIKTYAGRHLQGRRNLVHQFQATYKSESIQILPEHKPLLFEILQQWKVYEEGHLQDTLECREAIELQERLELFGRIYFVEGAPKGFILAERQGEKQVTLHFAKADIHIKGLYQFMYQDFAQHLEESVEWLNWEQDLGDKGLKQAKSAYQPDKLLKKMRLR